jgi:hypothetical protein
MSMVVLDDNPSIACWQQSPSMDCVAMTFKHQGTELTLAAERSLVIMAHASLLRTNKKFCGFIPMPRDCPAKTCNLPSVQIYRRVLIQLIKMRHRLIAPIGKTAIRNEGFGSKRDHESCQKTGTDETSSHPMTKTQLHDVADLGLPIQHVSSHGGIFNSCIDQRHRPTTHKVRFNAQDHEADHVVIEAGLEGYQILMKGEVLWGQHFMMDDADGGQGRMIHQNRMIHAKGIKKVGLSHEVVSVQVDVRLSRLWIASRSNAAIAFTQEEQITQIASR